MRDGDQNDLRAFLADLEVLCPRCQARKAPMEGQLCFKCSGETFISRLVAQRHARPRVEVLREACVPPKHLVPFEEPASWPRDTRRPDFDPSGWNGKPWAVGLVGEYGVGKTCFAVELLYRWLSRNLGLGRLYVRAEEIPGIAFDEEKNRWEGLRTAAILLIDDLARGYQGGGAAPVSSLISYREENMLPTIYTTNATKPADLAGGDESLVDRLKTGLFLRVTGKSRRALELEGLALRG